MKEEEVQQQEAPPRRVRVDDESILWLQNCYVEWDEDEDGDASILLTLWVGSIEGETTKEVAVVLPMRGAGPASQLLPAGIDTGQVTQEHARLQVFSPQLATWTGNQR
jgi:hypothetical protein